MADSLRARLVGDFLGADDCVDQARPPIQGGLNGCAGVWPWPASTCKEVADRSRIYGSSASELCCGQAQFAHTCLDGFDCQLSRCVFHASTIAGTQRNIKGRKFPGLPDLYGNTSVSLEIAFHIFPEENRLIPRCSRVSLDQVPSCSLLWRHVE